MRYLLAIVLLIICTSGFAQHSAKLSPLTRIYMQHHVKGGNLVKGYVYKKGANGQRYISALALLNSHAGVQETLDLLGVKTGTKAGNVWTLQIPIDKVPNVADVQGIAYLQVDEPIHPNLDSARRVTRVDSVQAGLGNLPQAFWGDGVVIGVIDAGFDYRHPSLFDTAGTVYRVKRVWEQLGTGTPPAGYTYGSELTNPTDMWTKGYDLLGSHGAHVAGIASGSGYGAVNKLSYRGMAPAADLVLIGITPPEENWTGTGMSDIIDGMNYVYSYAASVGKPAVVNLSWGCSIGPHDGLSLFSQACDALTGAGKLFVCSAGNNGDTKLHIQKTFTSSDTAVRSFVGFSTALPEKKTWIDIWGDSSKTFCVQLSLYTGASRIDSTMWICLDNQTHNVYMIGSNADTVFATLVTSDNEFNGKTRVFVELHSKTPDAILVSAKGTSGRVDMWSGIVVDTRGYYADFTNNGMSWATNGSTSITIGDMAATKSALAVAAYCSKNKYTNVSGSLEDYSFYATRGGLAPFSSRGPTRDGRIKPDIAGPGLVLGSAVNSYDSAFMTTGDSYSSVVEQWTDPNNSRQYSYAMLMGTSMSSPAAAGITALMLQAAPNLTPAQLKDAVTTTAIKDFFTGSALPNNIWGGGKINAMGAVAKAWIISGVGDVKAEERLFTTYPNPAQELVNVSFTAKKLSEAAITVTDITGKIQYRTTSKAQQGTNNISIPVKEWSRGVYLVTLSLGGEYQMQRVVVQ